MMPARATGMARRLPNRRMLRPLKSPAMIEMLYSVTQTDVCLGADIALAYANWHKRLAVKCTPKVVPI